MNDFKSYFLAAFTSMPAFFAAIDTPSWLTIVTSIVLPILFFIFSKTIDVLVQIYFKRKK